MKKRIVAGLLLSASILALVGLSSAVSADGSSSSSSSSSTAVDERYSSTVEYGAGLFDNQKEDVKSHFKVDSNTKEDTVHQADALKYLNYDIEDSKLISSVKVTKNSNSSGEVTVNILSPENITRITAENYRNASLTAGVKGVSIEVYSPIEVTGESALTGVYKALSDSGQALDANRVALAQNEVSTVGAVKDALTQAGGDADTIKRNSIALDKAVAEIKAELIKQNSTSKGLSNDTIKSIVQDKLKENGLSTFVSDEELNDLVNYFSSFSQSDAINDKSLMDSLKSLEDSISSKYKDVLDTNSVKGFFDGIGDFFKNMWAGLTGGSSNDKGSSSSSSSSN